MALFGAGKMLKGIWRVRSLGIARSVRRVVTNPDCDYQITGFVQNSENYNCKKMQRAQNVRM